ncbi:MAG: LysR family transcriptional regulator [Pseudomonadota bacterium]
MRLSDIDLRLLRVFKAVAEAGGFVKAQGALGISQPAISAQIARLEERLGARLCERGPQGFSLTNDGREVLDETSRMLDQLDQSAARLSRIGRQSAPHLRIGVIDCLITDPQNPLLAVLRDARALFPSMKVSVGVYDMIDCLAELRSSRLDVSVVGVAPEEEVPHDLETLHLYEEESSLYCAPDHPCAGIEDPDDLNAALAKSDISAFSFVKNPIGEELDPELFDAASEIPQANIESSLYLALAGTHVGLIPDHYAAAFVERRRLARIASTSHRVTSHINALRLKGAARGDWSERFWRMLGQSGG